MGPVPEENLQKKDIFRKNYNPLTKEQSEAVKEVKVKAQELWDLIESIVPENERSERAHLVNTGKTDIRKGVMMVVAGLTA